MYKVAVFVSGTFDLFNVFNIMAEQYQGGVFNSFLNSKKNGDFKCTCEQTLIATLRWFRGS